MKESNFSAQSCAWTHKVTQPLADLWCRSHFTLFFISFL